MWAMLQAAGAVLSRFGARYPAVKWAVIALVGLFAVEFVAERAIDLYAKLATVQANVAKTNADAKASTGIVDYVPVKPDKTYDNVLEKLQKKQDQFRPQN